MMMSTEIFDETMLGKSARFCVCFRGISRLCSAFIFSQWFKLAHICNQVILSTMAVSKESISKF